MRKTSISWGQLGSSTYPVNAMAMPEPRDALTREGIDLGLHNEDASGRWSDYRQPESPRYIVEEYQVYHQGPSEDSQMDSQEVTWSPLDDGQTRHVSGPEAGSISTWLVDMRQPQHSRTTSMQSHNNISEAEAMTGPWSGQPPSLALVQHPYNSGGSGLDPAPAFHHHATRFPPTFDLTHIGTWAPRSYNAIMPQTSTMGPGGTTPGAANVLPGLRTLLNFDTRWSQDHPPTPHFRNMVNGSSYRAGSFNNARSPLQDDEANISPYSNTTGVWNYGNQSGTVEENSMYMAPGPSPSDIPYQCEDCNARFETFSSLS
jgi:hypothetical protein